MDGLIIAAGKGSRLQTKGQVKPLVEILGLSILQRIISNAHKSGIDKFYIVTGYKRELLEKHVELITQKIGFKIKTIFNEQWEEKSNGISVLKASKYLKNNFMLLMSDHLFDTAIISDLIQENIESDEITLAVDFNLKYNDHVDVDDATKVLTENGKIIDIGKNLEFYNAFDTGIFLCSTEIFKAIEKSTKNGDDSLSGGIKFLAEKKKANIFNIENKFWIDIDDEKAFHRAERELKNRIKI